MRASLRDYLTHALGDPTIDQALLAVKVTQFEQRRRRELALEAMPEPESQEELDQGCLFAAVGA